MVVQGVASELDGVIVVDLAINILFIFSNAHLSPSLTHPIPIHALICFLGCTTIVGGFFIGGFTIILNFIGPL